MVERVVMVTGGSGLVGNGIQAALANGRCGETPANEKWVYLSSKEADLRDRRVPRTLPRTHTPCHARTRPCGGASSCV